MIYGTQLILGKSEHIGTSAPAKAQENPRHKKSRASHFWRASAVAVWEKGTEFASLSQSCLLQVSGTCGGCLEETEALTLSPLLPAASSKFHMLRMPKQLRLIEMELGHWP